MMTKEEVIEIMCNKDVDYIITCLNADGIETQWRDFYSVLQDIHKKYFEN